jgi:DNA-binding XRE family transcriptional regulator|tara:strand:- start:1199 stop:1480 length:282 start_codon:yes stop_codon:yes gene_type:complete
MPNTPVMDLMEECRTNLKLRVVDMAKVIGVSRITYYKWMKGGNMRHTTLTGVEAILRKITHIMREQHWPSGPEMTISSERRAERLLSLLSFYP